MMFYCVSPLRHLTRQNRSAIIGKENRPKNSKTL
jgi:hypothetical protein